VPVEVSCEVKSAGRYTHVLREEAAALMRLLEHEDCELSILLTNDLRMRRLNAYYRFRDRPTDVLSFAQSDKGEGAFPVVGEEYRPPDANLIGDVVISLETAVRQARDMRQSASRRLRTLLVHGVLHLLGYDHERSRGDAKAMFELQDKLESALEETFKSVPTAGGHPQ
jgi:rRNA maturation RNase YbeY